MWIGYNITGLPGLDQRWFIMAIVAVEHSLAASHGSRPFSFATEEKVGTKQTLKEFRCKSEAAKQKDIIRDFSQRTLFCDNVESWAWHHRGSKPGENRNLEER